MSDKEEPKIAKAQEIYGEGSNEAINDAYSKFESGSRDIRTENLTLVNHHHSHYYGDPNAKIENNQGGGFLSTLAKIGLGIGTVYVGAKLISSGGNDIKRLEEENQKLIEAKEENEIKVLALHEEEKYTWYIYNDKTLLQSNDTKTNKQYLFTIYDAKDITLCLFNRENPVYKTFGHNDVTVKNATSNIIYKVFQERTSDSKLIEKFKNFFYIEEVVDESGLYDSHFEREKEGRVKRAQYKVSHIDDQTIKLEFIKIK